MLHSEGLRRVGPFHFEDKNEKKYSIEAVVERLEGKVYLKSAATIINNINNIFSHAFEYNR